MITKTLYKFKGPDGRTITIKKIHQTYFVKRVDKKGLFVANIDVFSFGRLSYAVAKFFDMVGEYIEKQYDINQEAGN